MWEHAGRRQKEGLRKTHNTLKSNICSDIMGLKDSQDGRRRNAEI